MLSLFLFFNFYFYLEYIDNTYDILHTKYSTAFEHAQGGSYGNTGINGQNDMGNGNVRDVDEIRGISLLWMSLLFYFNSFKIGFMYLYATPLDHDQSCCILTGIFSTYFLSSF